MDSLLLVFATSLFIVILPRGFYSWSNWATLLIGAGSILAMYFSACLQLPGLVCSVSNSDLLSSLALSLFSSWVMHILLFYSFILVAVSSLLALLIST